jgi:integrase
MPRAAGARRLRESLAPGDVDAFVTTLRTHRDRAIVVAMLLGGLRSAEVRGLKLADVYMGRRRLRVPGKGGRDQVPVDPAFFTELAAYLRLERPPLLAIPECFAVLRGPTTGAPVTEAGLRSLFRLHTAMSGAAGPPAPAAPHLRNPSWPPTGWTYWRCGTHGPRPRRRSPHQPPAAAQTLTIATIALP